MGARIRALRFYDLITDSSDDERLHNKIFREIKTRKSHKKFFSFSRYNFLPRKRNRKIPSILQAISCCFLVLHHNITHEKTTFWRIQNRFVVVFIFFVSVSFEILVQCMLYAELAAQPVVVRNSRLELGFATFSGRDKKKQWTKSKSGEPSLWSVLKPEAH